MDAAISRFWQNGYIQYIGICETIVDNNQKITHQNPLQVQNAFNRQEVDRHNIRRACPTGK